MQDEGNEDEIEDQKSDISYNEEEEMERKKY